MIALVAAVPQETVLLRRFLSPCEVQNCGRRAIYRGNLFGHPVLLLHSGIGKGNAAAATTSLLEGYRPTLVISLGIAGAYAAGGLEIGDLALASEEIYGDEGVQAPEGFLDMQAIGFPLVQRKGLCLYSRFPINPQMLTKVRPVLETFTEGIGRRLAVGPFVTISTGSGTDALAAEMVRRTGGICESMEGAAIAQVCALYNTSLLAVRGISNRTGDRDPNAWDVKKGAEITQLAIRALLTDWHEKKDSA